MKPISNWNIFARMGFLESHVKSLNLAGRDMAVLEARLDNLMARVSRMERQIPNMLALYARPEEPTKEAMKPKQRVKTAGRPKAKDKAEEKILKRRAYAREYYLRTKRKKEQA